MYCLETNTVYVYENKKNKKNPKTKKYLFRPIKKYLNIYCLEIDNQKIKKT